MFFSASVAVAVAVAVDVDVGVFALTLFAAFAAFYVKAAVDCSSAASVFIQSAEFAAQGSRLIWPLLFHKVRYVHEFYASCELGNTT